jgi:peptidoglycan/xylan/chitin deacetylase (PgdA/CDA1 family)
MFRSSTLFASLLLGSAAIVGAPAAFGQDAPLTLGVPAVAKTAPAAAQAKPATAAPVAKPVTAAAKPAAVKVAATDPAAPKTPKPKKPAAAKTAAPAVPPEARRAALIAAMTAQPVPPAHKHVLQDIKTSCPGNPDAIGISKVIKLDTEGGFYVGQTYHTRMPLEPKEVVLTFDDGPMAGRTERVLTALEHECTKATFFIVGQMAKAYPETLRKTAAAGHTIGYHTMTHPLSMVKWPLAQAQDNIRGGWQTVDQILYGQTLDHPATPFFRYPGLFNSRAINEWFNGLGMGVFAIDAAGNDWLKGYITLADGPNVMNRALSELEARQGGILLLHDIKDSSSSIVAPLLRELKARGFKIVHMEPKNPPPKLIGGPVAGHIPTPAETWVPVAERGIDGYDVAKQLAQQSVGKAGSSSSAPLPAWDAARPAPQGTAAQTMPVAPQGTAAQTMPVTTGQPSTALTSSATSVSPAALAAAPATAAVVRTPDVSVSAKETTGSVPLVPAKPTSNEPGWFTSTASSLKGLAGAVGLW